MVSEKHGESTIRGRRQITLCCRHNCKLWSLQADPCAGFAFSDYAAIDDAGEFLSDPNWRRHNRPDGSPRLHLPDNVTVRNFHESGDNFVGASFLWRASVHDVVAVHDENT